MTKPVPKLTAWGSVYGLGCGTVLLLAGLALWGALGWDMYPQAMRAGLGSRNLSLFALAAIVNLAWATVSALKGSGQQSRFWAILGALTAAPFLLNLIQAG